ncbi:hypothetical protein FB451DRAFT_1570096 [Mycena latifolia]|nr:hypothetical protein FB451DRAFT_1570096 [Mycena latifolia]
MAAFSLPVNIVIGALLVGTWVGSLLYTVQIHQVCALLDPGGDMLLSLFKAVYYFRHFKNDNWKLKALVTFACIVDAAGMIANYAGVYLYAVTHWGDTLFLTKQYWPVPLFAISTCIGSSVVQTFLIVRYWLLTKNWFVSGILLLFMLAALVGGLTSGIMLALFTAFKDRAKVKVSATIWFVSEATVDVLIASALLFKLRTAKSSFKETKSLLNRLTVQTIQTGAAGATLALATLIAYLLNNESNGEPFIVEIGIAICLSRVNMLTLLFNLNIRKVHGRGSRTISSGGNPSTREERIIPVRSEAEEFGGIHIYGSTLVRIDSRTDYPAGTYKAHPGQDGSNPNSGDMEMRVKDSAQYSGKKQPALFPA